MYSCSSDDGSHVKDRYITHGESTGEIIIKTNGLNTGRPRTPDRPGLSQNWICTLSRAESFCNNGVS